jgi:LPXTG-motif cell wall-anchored protein
MSNAKSYQISLFYDKATNEIRLDRFITEPVQLVDTEDSILFDERVSLPVDNNFQVNLEAYQYSFPQTLIYPYTEGAFVINVDYFPHVKAINIKSQNGKILTIDVSETSTCNQNFVCEYEKGENTNTCIHDCVPQYIGESVTFSEETLRVLQAQNGVIRNEEGVVLLSTNNNPDTIETPSSSEENTSNSSNILLLIGGIFFLVAGVGVFFWKLRKR